MNAELEYEKRGRKRVIRIKEEGLQTDQSTHRKGMEIFCCNREVSVSR